VYRHIPHPHIAARKAHGPPKHADHQGSGLNGRIALLITRGVGTMWCAYLFAVIALFGLPAALKPGGEGIVAWIAQTFLQLVLLSVIIVGQNLSAKASDARADATFKDAEAVLAEALEIQKHLAAQDLVLTRAVNAMSGSASPPSTPPR